MTAVTLRHSGAVRRTELRCTIAHLRISRFRVRCFASPRNDSAASGKGRRTTMPLAQASFGNSLFNSLRPTLPILIGTSLMLSLSMGLRQSLGIFMQPLTRDVGISVSDFTLAIAVQNLAWGFLQPLAGAWTVRYGFRPGMIVGSLFFIAGP